MTQPSRHGAELARSFMHRRQQWDGGWRGRRHSQDHRRRSILGPQSSGTAETLFGVSFSDSNTGTAVGGTFGQSEIFRTTDGGEHWIPQANPGTEFLFDVSFTDTNNRHGRG